MKVEQFFAKYANTPLKKRFKTLDIYKNGLMTLDSYYFRLKELEDLMRPLRIEEEKLLEKVISIYGDISINF
jgi:hypothetical protein